MHAGEEFSEPNWEERKAVRLNREAMSHHFRRDPRRVFKDALEWCWTFTNVYIRSQRAGPDINHLLGAAGLRWPDLAPGDSSRTTTETMPQKVPTD